ncbi:hypothetical protein P3T35_004637 [Kitasatospora sp. GP30]|uniref:hypothetical protein n=1 Tax=Kitasatospora sp. GP30 TaxID=3035084 RepID=UPI000CBC7934|nr:hypothetical protein [Kitasatospora sp. GP30]MDH6142609.1 hypothetical protein [Kitasatospora sp. GP30]
MSADPLSENLVYRLLRSVTGWSAMTDLVFIGVTVLVFGVLGLIAKGVERL